MGRPVPGSCCGHDLDSTCSPTDNIYREGCSGKISDLFKTGLKTLGGVAVGVAIVEVN